jgi:di/tricarboxylate transporter
MGWSGAMAVLCAYAALSMKKIEADSYSYHLLNLFGGLFLAVYAVAKSAFASTFINIIWSAIGIYALYKLAKRPKPPAL